jgi:hypothetical protein
VAFELRATLQALSKTTFPMTTDQEVLKAALVDLPLEPPDFITQDLTDIVSALRQVDSLMLEIIRTRFSAMKGGSPGEYMDAARLLPLASGLRRRRFLPLEHSGAGSSERRDLADPVRNVAKRVSDGLSAALAKEAAAREELKRRVDEALGERTSRDGVLQCIQRLIDAAGLLAVQGTPGLLALKGRFEKIAYVEFIAALRTADSTKLDVRQLRSGVGQAATIVDELIRMATALIERTASELTGRLVAAGVDPEEKVRVTVALKTDLEAISLQLQRYNDGNVS